MTRLSTLLPMLMRQRPAKNNSISMDTTFHNTNAPKDRRVLLEKKARAYVQKLIASATDYTYATPETALAIAGDAKYQSAIKRKLAAFKEVEHVVLVGIGGSSLGTEAVYRALAQPSSPTLLVLDAVDADSLAQFDALLATISDPKKLAVVVISKSGATTETLVNATYVFGECEKKFGAEYVHRCVCVGNDGTSFLNAAREKHMLTFTIPDSIGGRYSVFTAVGMVPLILLGIDVHSLRKGAKDALTKDRVALSKTSAVTLALHAEQGFHTLNFFTFSNRLYTLGYWYRQLFAESIGKPTTKEGVAFLQHMHPTVSTSVDLHSMAQMYLGGYTHLYTHFISCKEQNVHTTHADHWLLGEHLALGNKKHTAIAHAIKEGVLTAYDEQKLPYSHTELAKCNAYELGLFMASSMIEVMCLAHLCNVDAFTQPSVELYKVHTRAALAK